MNVVYPLRVFLDLSTSHLMPTTRSWLETGAYPVDMPTDPALLSKFTYARPLYGSTPYGWFVFADESPSDDWPADLVACMNKARELGAEYILFDADASVSDLLPNYEPTLDTGNSADYRRHVEWSNERNRTPLSYHDWKAHNPENC